MRERDSRFLASTCDLQCSRDGVKRRCKVSYVVSMLAAAALLHSSNGHDFALLSQSSAVEPEDDWDGNHHRRETAEQSPSPLDTQVGEHLASEEREASRDDGAKHNVGGYSGGGAGDHKVSFLSFLVV